MCARENTSSYCPIGAISEAEAEAEVEAEAEADKSASKVLRKASVCRASRVRSSRRREASLGYKVSRPLFLVELSRRVFLPPCWAQHQRGQKRCSRFAPIKMHGMRKMVLQWLSAAW